MGGFFVRKVLGAASLGVHGTKVWPLLVHPSGAEWGKGHFGPLLAVGVLGNVALMAFYGLYWSELVASGASEMVLLMTGALLFESLVFGYYLLSTRKPRSGPAVALKDGKTPHSVVNGILARTVSIVSSAVAVVALRDLLLPGFVLEFFPRDDIYLEWTNAFLHSPPEGSPEADDHGLTSPLFVGDKFVSQLMALHLLILCIYKVVSGVVIRYRADGGGEYQARMIWQGQAMADALVLVVFRLFTPSAQTASLDLRWHLMALAYETFILGTLCLLGMIQQESSTRFPVSCLYPPQGSTASFDKPKLSAMPRI